MAQFEVELWGLGNHDEIRPVELPGPVSLERIFQLGQNDVQPQRMRSVSVGDVIRHEGRRLLVLPLGFREVPADWRPSRDPPEAYRMADRQDR